MDDTVDLLKIKIEKAKRALPLETVNAINSVDLKIVVLGMRIKHGYTFEQLGDLELETELLLSGLVSPENYPKELSRRMGISKTATDELVDEMNELVFKKIREELVKNTERKKTFADQNPVPPSENIELTRPANYATEPGPAIILSKDAADDRNILKKDGIEIIDQEITPAIPKVALLPEREVVLGKIEKPELTPAHPLELLGNGKIESTPAPVQTKEEVHPILAQKLTSSVQIPSVKTDHSLGNLTKTTVPSAYPPKADPYRLSPDE